MGRPPKDQKQKDADWVEDNIRNPRSNLHSHYPKHVMESDREKIEDAIGVKQNLSLQARPRQKKLSMVKFSMKAVTDGGARLAKDGKYLLFCVPKDPQADRFKWEIDEAASKETIRVELEKFVKGKLEKGKPFAYKDRLIVAFLSTYCAHPSFVCDLVDNEFDRLMGITRSPDQPPLEAVTNLPAAGRTPFAKAVPAIHPKEDWAAAHTNLANTMNQALGVLTDNAVQQKICNDQQAQATEALMKAVVGLADDAAQQKKCNEKQAQINEEQAQTNKEQTLVNSEVKEELNTLRKSLNGKPEVNLTGFDPQSLFKFDTPVDNTGKEDPDGEILADPCSYLPEPGSPGQNVSADLTPPEPGPPDQNVSADLTSPEPGPPDHNTSADLAQPTPDESGSEATTRPWFGLL